MISKIGFATSITIKHTDINGLNLFFFFHQTHDKTFDYYTYFIVHQYVVKWNTN